MTLLVCSRLASAVGVASERWQRWRGGRALPDSDAAEACGGRGLPRYLRSVGWGSSLSYTDRDTAHVLAALIVLLVSAHACGYLFARFRQPPVIGEILGGILLGPTLLERVWPSAHDWLFPTTGATAAVLGAAYQLGLLLLMFTAGTQMRGLISRSATRVVGWVAVAGLVLPFLAGLGVFAAMDLARFEGTAHDRTALLLVFAIALAVTSIPVISRIMLDLGLLKTRFARIVLSVAVIEDVVLYVVLAVALGSLPARVAPNLASPANWAGIPAHPRTTLITL